MRSCTIVIALVSLALGPACGQSDCAYPTESDLEGVIAQSILTGDNPSAPTVDVLDFHPVCLAYSQERDRYRYVSIVVEYTCTGNANCPSGTVVEQFDSQCISGTWSHSVESNTDDTRTVNPTANFSTPTREDCVFCLPPRSDIARAVSGLDSITHCVACPSNCDEGLMRCYRNQATHCCQYYDGNMCTESCTNPKISNAAFDCVCPGFFLLPTCSECGLVCENGGTPEEVNCTECECPVGFTSYNCSADIDECSGMPCENEATCENTYGSFTCTCADGYTGLRCGNYIDECDDSPCENNGSCVNSLGSFSCMCAAGYMGDLCSEDIDECAEKPCLYGGTCEDGVNEYKCNCPAGRSGENCADCTLNLCELCSNQSGPALCVNCVEGYTLIASLCECDIPNCIKCDGVPAKCIECDKNYKVDENGKCVCVYGFEEDKHTCLQVSRTGGDDTDIRLISIIVASVIGFFIVVLLITLITIATVVSLRRRVQTNYNTMETKKFENPLFMRPETLEDTGGGAFNDSTTL